MAITPAPALWVLRPQDLVDLTFRFVNFTLEPPDVDKFAHLHLTNPALLGLIVVDFPPQSLVEEAFFEDAPGITTPDGAPASSQALPALGAVSVRISGVSRLVFMLPPGQQEIAYTLDGLLAQCRTLRVRTALKTVGGDRTYPAQPGNDVSALEIPCGVLLTPSRDAGWAHSDEPVTDGANKRVALWHTRLGVRRIKGPDVEIDEVNAAGQIDEGRTVRATWEGTPVRISTTLADADRRDLIRYGRNGLPPIRVNRLMLSTLGAWFDVKGQWDPTAFDNGPNEPPASLEGWEHRMTLGRDHYVRVVKAGFLYPFGHRASLVKVSERKLQPSPDGKPAAYVRQRMFIIVRDPEESFAQRDLPFKQVDILTLVTPSLADPQDSELAEELGERAFWPMVKVGNAAQDFLFHLRALDHENQVLEFVSPLAFIDRSVASSKAIQDWIQQSPANFAQLAAIRRERTFGGRRLAYAQPLDADCGFETDMVEVRARPRTSVIADADGAPFLPTMVRAQARIPAIRNLTGKDAPATFKYNGLFVDPSKSNPLELIADIEGGAPQVRFDSPQGAGGLVTPNLDVTALSRTKGALGGELADLQAGTFNPNTFFDPADLPKILGILSLAELIPPGSGGASMPRIATIDPRTTTLRWDTSLAPPAPPAPQATITQQVFQSNGAMLSLTVTRKLASGPDKAEVSSTGSVTDFAILIPPALPVLKIPFEEIGFSAVEGKKVDVTVKMGTVEFLGPLSFVNTLAKLLPPAGFDDPPSLEVTAEGIKAGFSLGLPTVGMGVFSLQNISLSAGFHLPLISNGSAASAASLNFAFAERHNPFLVTVSLFGGGGFVGIDLGLDGLNSLEASIEFGGAVAMSIGVASGGVSVMAGIYIKLEEDKPVLLAGFLRCVGVLEVLGIVSISAQFYLELSYQDPKVAGTASLIVKVKVLFFSKKVTLTVHRDFQSSPPPTFADVMFPSHWDEYCDAFAPEA